MPCSTRGLPVARVQLRCTSSSAKVGLHQLRDGCALRPACPAAIARPKLSATTRSEMLITRLMWCSTSSTVSLKRSRSSRISAPSLPTSSWFRPLAGSSSSRSLGSAASARASSTRFCVPKGRSATRVAAAASRPSSASSARAFCAAPRSLSHRVGQAQRVGEEPAARAAVAADHDVVEHRHGAKQRQVLERAADAERGDAVARHRRGASWPSKWISPRSHS